MASDNEYMREYMKKRYYRRWDKAVELLGGKCFRCGRTDNLNFDHTDPSSKEFEIGLKLAGVAQAKLDAELAKCQLLCEDCHKDKTREDMGWHQGSAAISLLCAYCGKGIERTYDQVGNRIKHGQVDFYCNQSCAAHHFGNGRPKVKKPLPHGKRAIYNRGCRCPECTRSQREYMREYNAKKRLGL